MAWRGAWLTSLGLLMGPCAGLYSQVSFLARPCVRVLGIYAGHRSCYSRNGKRDQAEGWLNMRQREQGGHSKVVAGGGGFPVTPPFTLQKFSEGDMLLLEEIGIPHTRGEWLLLTDKRSTLREVFALETSLVRREKFLFFSLLLAPSLWGHAYVLMMIFEHIYVCYKYYVGERLRTRTIARTHVLQVMSGQEIEWGLWRLAQAMVPTRARVLHTHTHTHAHTHTHICSVLPGVILLLPMRKSAHARARARERERERERECLCVCVCVRV